MPLSSELAADRLVITAGARKSPLSQAQMEEIREAMAKAGLGVKIEPFYLDTKGDRDRTTSLRSLGRTNFFTKELDEGVLGGQFRIAVHSAKDLPDPIPPGIAVVAITKGVDPSDSLVLREGDSLSTLPPGAKIGSSSTRREMVVKALRSDVQVVDIRGNVGQRLAQMTSGKVDAVVVAEAALIRLGLTHLNRIRLPGPTVPFQGQLAVTARVNDEEMATLFRPLDTRPEHER